MSVEAKDIEFYLSGGATNLDPDASLGGVISSQDVVAEAIVHNLFDPIPQGDLSGGQTDYRCFYVQNNNATDTWFSVEVWVEVVTPSSDTQIDIGLDPAGINGTATTIANDTTAPGSVTFSHPTSSPGVSIGNLTAGDYQAVWLRRVLSSSASAAPDDRITLRFSGTDV